MALEVMHNHKKSRSAKNGFLFLLLIFLVSAIVSLSAA